MPFGIEQGTTEYAETTESQNQHSNHVQNAPAAVPTYICMYHASAKHTSHHTAHMIISTQHACSHMFKNTSKRPAGVSCPLFACAPNSLLHEQVYTRSATALTSIPHVSIPISHTIRPAGGPVGNRPHADQHTRRPIQGEWKEGRMAVNRKIHLSIATKIHKQT